jgi:5-methylcytosine-specific restriction endonuclease McrA
VLERIEQHGLNWKNKFLKRTPSNVFIDSRMKKINLSNVLWGRPKTTRKPVSQSARTKALVRSRGKCEKCGESLKGVTPHIHHKDGNPRNNKLANLQVLCPNCHSTARVKPKRRKTKPSFFEV